MKEVEVSAIKEECEEYSGCAISPCGTIYYNYVNGWYEHPDSDAIAMFNIGEGKVHRGIFRIKVVED